MRIFNSECFKFMEKMEKNSIDTIITDPPYGLKFMGKRWDYDVPNSTIWRACLDVLKPGGTMLVFAGSRTQHRMAVAIEDAGFILKDCIMWIYGSGFPKAIDISKQLDKGHERKVVGRNPNSRENCDKSNTLYESGTVGKINNITEPTTPEAQLWNGWKSHGLKPAYEPILVCMKPNDGTYAENALKHGVSGLNIDGGRIKTDDVLSAEYGQPSGSSCYNWNKEKKSISKNGKTNSQGRFPANVIFDEEAAKMLDEQTGTLKSGKDINPTTKGSQTSFFGNGQEYYNQETNYGDKGGASRFFYCAKASKAERNAGCEDMETTMAGMSNGAQINGEGYDKGQSIGLNKVIARKNFHPTVKPLKLMEYLCTLTKTPTGGIVFDPFMGSGTTGIACKNTGREFIGCEMDEDYFRIAEKRILHG